MQVRKLTLRAWSNLVPSVSLLMQLESNSNTVSVYVVVFVGIDMDPLATGLESDHVSPLSFEGSVYTSRRRFRVRAELVVVCEHLLVIVLDHHIDTIRFSSIVHETNPVDPFLRTSDGSEATAQSNATTKGQELASFHRFGVAN